MAMVCPQCDHVYEQKLSCPTCGVRLQYQLKVLAARNPLAQEQEQWQQTPWGRMLIGLLLAQGLGYALQQILTAGLLASGEQAGFWTTLWGVVLLHLVQGTTLLAGGALSGAGQVNGPLYGGFIGLINGLIFMVVQRSSGEFLPQIAVYGQPLLHMAFGAMGGLLGRFIWKPSPIFESSPTDASKIRPLRIANAPHLLSGKINTPRVLVGMIVVVVGLVWSTAIMEWLLEASQGTLSIRTHLQAKLLSWEISALAILVGGGIAGACTANGLKQGLLVGIGASLIFLGIQLGDPKSILETTVFMILLTLFLALIGGWFGRQLFPPLGPMVPHRSRILAG